MFSLGFQALIALFYFAIIVTGFLILANILAYLETGETVNLVLVKTERFYTVRLGFTEIINKPRKRF